MKKSYRSKRNYKQQVRVWKKRKKIWILGIGIQKKNVLLENQLSTKMIQNLMTQLLKKTVQTIKYKLRLEILRTLQDLIQKKLLSPLISWRRKLTINWKKILTKNKSKQKILSRFLTAFGKEEQVSELPITHGHFSSFTLAQSWDVVCLKKIRYSLISLTTAIASFTKN